MTINKWLAAGIILIAASGSAQAQLFGVGTCQTLDGPCSGLVDQIVSYARQGLQLEREITTAEQEVINTLKLPQQLFRDATGSIQNITNLLPKADLYAHQTGAFIGNLAAPAYPLPPNGMQQLIAHGQAVANAIGVLGNVIDGEGPNLAASAATLNSLQNEALGNDGRQQTLQDQAQLEAAHGQQTQSHEAISMATAQAQHAAMLAHYDRQAMADQWGDLAATRYTPYPMTGQGY